MNLNAIYERLSEINEIKIIGKDFWLGDTECHLAGLYRSGKQLLLGFIVRLAYAFPCCMCRRVSTSAFFILPII